MFADLRVEIEISLAQPVELFKMLVVNDGTQHAGKLPKTCLLIAGELAARDEPRHNIRLPQRNETIPLFGHGRLAIRIVHNATANAVTIIEA